MAALVTGGNGVGQDGLNRQSNGPIRKTTISVETLNITESQGVTHNKEISDVTTQFNFIAEWLKAQAKTERGASMVEYALLLALIAIIAIGALTLLGQTVSENFSDINSSLG